MGGMNKQSYIGKSKVLLLSKDAVNLGSLHFSETYLALCSIIKMNPGTSLSTDTQFENIILKV